MGMRHKAIFVQDGQEKTNMGAKHFPLFAIAYEKINEATEPLLHKYSRFWYITKGRATFRIQGNTVELSAGHLVGILPWQCTEVVSVSETLEYYLIVYEHDMVQALIKNTMKFLDTNIDFTNIIYLNTYIKVKEHDKVFIEDIIYKIEKEYQQLEINIDEENNFLASFSVANLLIQLIILFYRTSTKRSVKEKPFHVGNNIEMFHYIYYHLNERISLQELSERFYMSKSAISKYIYDTIGVTYSDLIATMRIMRLINTLHFTDDTLQELAIYLGYVDAAHLSNFFKSKMGVNISEYKQEQRHMNKNQHEYTEEIPKILEYVIRNFHQNLSKKELCMKFDVPLNSFNEIFEYYTDKNFHDFVNYIRIVNASEMMLTTKKSLSTIAYDVGFNTTKTFNRNFVKIYGKTPVHFRKEFSLQNSLI